MIYVNGHGLKSWDFNRYRVVFIESLDVRRIDVTFCCKRA